MSELESVTLFCTLDCQETHIPSTFRMKPLMLLLLTRSPAYSLSLKQTIFQSSLVFPVGHNFKPKFFLSKIYLITCRNSLKTTGFAPLLAFDSSLVMLEICGLKYLARITTYLHLTNILSDHLQRSFNFKLEA